MKPENPEMFERAQGLFKRATGAGERALRDVRAAGERAWARATDAPNEGARRRRILMLLGGGIFAVVALLAVLSRLGGDGAVRTEVETALAVSVAPVAVRTFEQEIAINGEARPVNDIQVAAPATGVRILEILVDEGDSVRAGQAMARLDTNVAQAQIRSAQAAVAEAQAAAVRARSAYERAESIRDSGALSAEAIEQRRAEAAAADARLSAQRAALQEVNARLGGGYVRAPASGLVIDRMAEIGRNVDGQVLFRIAGGNALEVAAEVAEADALALQQGQPATFTLVDGSTVAGRLRRLPASIDSRTRTGEALFALPSGTRVRAGMYLRGEAQLLPRDVLAVPQSSILYTNGQAYVFVIDDTNHARRRDVALGARSGDYVEIVSGIDVGERLVGAGGAFLQDGDPVRPIESQPAAPAASNTDLRGREG